MLEDSGRSHTTFVCFHCSDRSVFACEDCSLARCFADTARVASTDSLGCATHRYAISLPVQALLAELFAVSSPEVRVGVGYVGVGLR
jgi:hypothetical protein